MAPEETEKGLLPGMEFYPADAWSNQWLPGLHNNGCIVMQIELPSAPGCVEFHTAVWTKTDTPNHSVHDTNWRGLAEWGFDSSETQSSLALFGVWNYRIWAMPILIRLFSSNYKIACDNNRRAETETTGEGLIPVGRQAVPFESCLSVHHGIRYLS